MNVDSTTGAHVRTGAHLDIDGDITVSATDTTDITVTIDDVSDTARRALFAGPASTVLPNVYFAVDILSVHVTLSRDTQATLAAAVGTAAKSAGAVLVTAANDGAITASVPSTLVGTAHVTVAQDDAIAEVSGATFLVGSLEVSASTAGEHTATARTPATRCPATRPRPSRMLRDRQGQRQDRRRRHEQAHATAADLVLVPGTPLITITGSRAWNSLVREVAAAVEDSTIVALDGTVAITADATRPSSRPPMQLRSQPVRPRLDDAVAVAAV